LDYEAKAADQVPLLMRMKKDDLALEKAIMSGDTDLGKQTQHAHCGHAPFSLDKKKIVLPSQQ